MKMPFSILVRRWSSEATGEPARVMGNFSEIITFFLEQQFPAI